MSKVKTLINYVAAGLAVTASVSAIAATCELDYVTKQQFMVGTPDSKAVSRTQNRNTWQDWIWRGDIFRCNASGGNKCTYAWGRSNTKGYSWELGGGLDPKGVPMIKGWLNLLAVNGTYGQTKSWTESFTWSQTFDGGVFVQPVQVVERRWIAGDFQGVLWRTNSRCSRLDWGGVGWSNQPGTYYWWEDGYRWGKWDTNAEQKRYGMYHWWRG